jgi:hypothetical protein
MMVNNKLDRIWIESNHGLFKALSQNFPGRTEEKKRTVIRDSLCPGRDTDQPRPEFNSGALPF